MSKLYYGNGNCSIDGEGIKIRGIELKFEGSIEITDKTSSDFVLMSGNNKIIIFPIGFGELSELFDYEGNMIIKKVIVSDNESNKITTQIKKIMDYSELLGVSESLTRNSEDMDVSYSSGKEQQATTMKHHYIPDQHTSNFDGSLYLSDGTSYTGSFHVHFDGAAMTGSEHNEFSKDLYYKKIDSDKLLPTKQKIKSNSSGMSY